jgi:hypothetical protein
MLSQYKSYGTNVMRPTTYSMTRRQRFAFEHPCFREVECAAIEHRRVKFPWSTILTLNIGLDDASFFDGLPLWHCSIAFLAWNGLPVPLTHWGDDLLLTCEQLIRHELLAGIGDDAQEHILIGDRALHFLRCCSAREIERLKARGFWRARWN